MALADSCRYAKTLSTGQSTYVGGLVCVVDPPGIDWRAGRLHVVCPAPGPYLARWQQLQVVGQGPVAPTSAGSVIEPAAAPAAPDSACIYTYIWHKLVLSGACVVSTLADWTMVLVLCSGLVQGARGSGKVCEHFSRHCQRLKEVGNEYSLQSSIQLLLCLVPLDSLRFVLV